jgi:hypothetical protein
MSGYGKLILFIGAVLLCAVGAILSLAFANSIEHDGDADALKTAGDLVENQGMISSYSIGDKTAKREKKNQRAATSTDIARRAPSHRRIGRSVTTAAMPVLQKRDLKRKAA